MIPMPPPVSPAASAVASLRASSRQLQRSWLAALCAVLALLLFGAASIAPAQTAHFTGTLTTLGSGFDLPAGVAVDSSGNVYVADYMNNAVKEILAVNGSIPASPTVVTLGSGFSHPIAVAVDGNGDVYVADNGNQEFKEILAVNGSVPASPTIVVLGSSSDPGGIAVDSQGNVYVVAGTPVTYLSLSAATNQSAGSGSIRAGVSMGSLAIPSLNAGSVYEILAVNGSLPASPTMRVLTSSFPYPIGVAVDGNGNVYVAGDCPEGQASSAPCGGVIELLAVNGSIPTSPTIEALGSGYNFPIGVAVDGEGNVFVADEGNSAVKKLVAINGSIPTSPTILTLGSGFTYPFGVTLDANGNLYVADAGNNRVVEMTLPLSKQNFGAVNIGTTSPANTLNFVFDTAGTLGSTAVLTQGAAGLDFQDAGTGTCTANTAYTEGEICTINVTFTPRFAGIRSGAVVLYNSTGNAIASGYVQGTGVGPQIAFQPGAHSTLGSGFNEPVSVAVDGSGNVYVADTANNAVKEILAVNGSIPASPTIKILGSGFNQPSSVAVDSSGNLYVADSGNSAVKEILAVNGGIPASPAIVTLGSGFNTPKSVAVDRAGNVFVADYGNSAIKEILAINGSIPASPTILTLETHAAAFYITIDGSGNVWVTGVNGALLEILAVNGSIPALPTSKLILTGLNELTGLAVDGSENVYVANNQNAVSEIHAVNGSIPSSPTITTLSSGFIFPTGLAVDGGGNIFVADAGGNRVVKLDVADAPSWTFAATPVGSTSVDSPQTVTVENIGNAALTFPIPLTGSNPSIAANFTLNSSGASACPLLSSGSSTAGTLAAGASCQLPISFVPTVAGVLSGSLVLKDNNLNAAAPGYATQSIGLSGVGTQFTISAPAAVNLIQGTSSTATVTVIPQDGFTGSVQLFFCPFPRNGLPPGVTVAFSPNPTTATSVLTLTASGTAALGTYNVAVCGNSGSLIATTALTLTVSPAPTFSVDASPASPIIVQGGSGTSLITVTDLYGFTGSVQLAAANLPNGVTASFTPNPTTGTSTLTLTASGTAALGQATVTVTGTSGALTEPTFLVLTVNPVVVTAPPLSNFGAVSIGTTSPVIPLTFTVVNGGTLGSIAVLTQGATGLDFADAGSDSCVAGTAYAAGQTCMVNVTFTPKFAGTRNGAVVLNDANGNVLATGYLQGTGVGPQINFLPNTESTVASSGLYDPYGVAVDGSGNVYVADTSNNRILKESFSGGSYVESTIPTSSLDYPGGIAVDGSANIFIADLYNLRVLKESPSAGGYSESTVFQFTAGDEIFPAGVAVDGSGNVYCSNYLGNVYKATLSAGSYIQSVISTSSTSIEGVAVDGDGNIYVADTANDRILKETSSEGSYTESTVPTVGLGAPAGIAVDGNGNVYITDSYNNIVLKETLSAGGYAQSTISTSQLDLPLGVAVDGNGNVYIADTFDFRVLKEDFAGPPSLTFASASVGSTSTDSPQTVTVENVGNAALSLPIPSTGNNPSIAASFTLNSSGSSACPLLSAGSSTAGTLAAGASCLLPISFTPASAGALSGSLVLTDNNLNAAAPGYAAQTILLSGTGTQATPTITWATPAAITYGTPLSAAQLNATASVAGTFTYSPLAGTVLTAGQHTLTVTFAPTDFPDYTPATASVTLTVNKATPTITWATPKAITYGTPLSATQLDATSTVAGTFTYSPAAGTVLAAGAQTLKVTFAPKDSADYTTAAGSVTLTVNPAPSFTLAASPASLTVTQGASGKSTIAVTALNGFTGKVTLTASGLPNGVTASFATNPTTGTSVLTLAASNTAVTGTYNVTITGTSGSLTATTTIALTVNGFACHIGYTIESQWKNGFEAAITINNTGVKSISNWTLTWTFANGQKITDIWDGTETQSGANVTVTNTSYNGSIPAGGSYTGLGFNASWNNTTNAVPTSFAVNGTTCK